MRVAGPREFKYFPIVDLATCWGASSFSREYIVATRSNFPK